MSRVFRWIAIAAVTFFVLLFLLVNGAWVIELPFRFAVGWISHVRSVVPRMTINVAGVALFALALPLAAWLTHSSATWLWNDALRPWRWKWTAMGLAAVMLMFVSGVAATGVVHQAGWLIRSPVPLLTNGRESRNRVRCASNLEQIAQAIALHEKEGGARPRSRADVARLVLTQDLVPEVFVCPASNAERPMSTEPIDWAQDADDDRHFSYVVCPEPLVAPDGVGRVVMYEPIENHTDGLNVLYEDGHAEWLDGDVARAWLASAPPTTQPAAP